MNPTIILGSRGSALALAQVTLVENALRAVVPDLKIELKKITTSGDRRADYSDVMATGAGVKGLFTKEIEQALIDGQIDVAVHSCKDLPGELADGLEVCAVLERADTADVLITRDKGFSELPVGAVIGTGSVRRRRQLNWLRPDLSVQEIRGNVPTRLQKLADLETLAGIVLARAGLDRLGLDLNGWHVEVLPMQHAIGQGAVALECRSGDFAVLSLLARINHGPTFCCVRAERELLRLLNGDCNLPVGVMTRLEGSTLAMDTIIFGEEGVAPVLGSVSGPLDAPEELAVELHRQVLAQSPGSE